MDWDLNAVVRSCSKNTAPPNNITPNPTTPTLQNTQAAAAADAIENDSSFDNVFNYLDSFNFENEDDPFGFADLLHPNDNGLQEMQNSFTSLLPIDSPVSDIGAIYSPYQPQVVQNHFQPQPPLPPPQTTVDIHPIQQEFYNQWQQQNHQMQGSDMILPVRTTTQSPAPKPKKKKSAIKIVTQVAAENLCSDAWTWRKYGQKPIKGSPYPRNYYRCSSSKGCTARKQIERSNIDSNMFTVTYTGDHTHPLPINRSFLAGSVRSKTPTNQNLAINEPEVAPMTSPLLTSTEQDTGNNLDAVGQMEVNSEFFAGEGVGDDEMEGDEGDVLIPNISALDEDMLKGFQLLGGAVGDGVFGSNSKSSGPGLGLSSDFGDQFSNLMGGSGGSSGSRGF